jgi:hypothetical protein
MTKNYKLWFALIAISTLSLFMEKAPANISADSAESLMTQWVRHQIQILNISDLNFGEAYPGAGPKTIQPGQQDNLENASFVVTGEPYRSFFIQLPAGSTVMRLGAGGPQKEIQVGNFQSNPSRIGILGSLGKANVYVGATRAALSPDQKAGFYLGTFDVTVVY